MAFVQATIPVENKQAFEKLQELIERALTGNVDRFMSEVKSTGLRIRQFEDVLKRSLVEKANGGIREEALVLYESLAMSDQAQMREFYLTRVEKVDEAVREKYSKLYRYS